MRTAHTYARCWPAYVLTVEIRITFVWAWAGRGTPYQAVAIRGVGRGRRRNMFRYNQLSPEQRISEITGNGRSVHTAAGRYDLRNQNNLAMHYVKTNFWTLRERLVWSPWPKG